MHCDEVKDTAIFPCFMFRCVCLSCPFVSFLFFTFLPPAKLLTIFRYGFIQSQSWKTFLIIASYRAFCLSQTSFTVICNKWRMKMHPCTDHMQRDLWNNSGQSEAKRYTITLILVPNQVICFGAVTSAPVLPWLHTCCMFACKHQCVDEMFVQIFSMFVAKQWTFPISSR